MSMCRCCRMTVIIDIKLYTVSCESGDIAPDSPTLSGGFVILDGVKRNIVQGTKHRNPDGKVNFTELDVI